MRQESYLIFELANAFYGISTVAVQEIFLLPEVTPIAETASWVVGVINLRGAILPVIDLPHLLGQASPLLQPTDSVIIVQWQNQRIGMVVQQVCEVAAIAHEDIQRTLTSQASIKNTNTSITFGITTLESKLVTLIDPTSLVQSDPITVQQELSHHGSNGTALGLISHPNCSQQSSLFAHLSLEAQEQLKIRAQSLSQKLQTQDSNGVLPMAILKLEGEYFGIGLELVQELIDIRKLTPIPCCPKYILGNMNLRGEIITLIDISHILNLPRQSLENRKKAIVAQFRNSSIGIAVDNIVEITELHLNQILAVPAAHHATNDEYLQGVASYQGEMMSIINLPKVITADTLIVNEEI